MAITLLGLTALFCITLTVTSLHRDCAPWGCEVDSSLHFQLLQYQMSVRSAQDYSEWIGKGGNMIRSGSTSAIPPTSLSAGPAWSWAAPNGGVVRGSPVIDSKGAIYQSTIDGDIFKFSRTGDVLWNFTTSGISLPGNPVLMEGVLYTIRVDGQMAAVNSDDGKLLWQTRACGMASGDTHSIIAGEGLVLASCLELRDAKINAATTVVACNATSGAVLWKFRPDMVMYNWIGSIQSGSVLFSDTLGGVYRLLLRDGSVVWKVPAPSPPAGTTGGLTGARNGLAYVSSNLQGENTPTGTGLVSAYSVEDGRLVWRRAFPKFPANSGPAATTHGNHPFVVVAIGTNPSFIGPQGQVLDLDSFDNSPDHRHPSKVVALDLLDGHTLWEFDLPDWHGGAAGDTPQHTCLPDSYANPSIAGDGAVFVAGMSGKVYRFYDHNGDGKLEAEHGEISEFDTGNAFQAAPAISEGILATSPCNGLSVFLP